MELGESRRVRLAARGLVEEDSGGGLLQHRRVGP